MTIQIWCQDIVSGTAKRQKSIFSFSEKDKGKEIILLISFLYLAMESAP